MDRLNYALPVYFAKRERWFFDFDNFTKAGIWWHEVRWSVEMTSMLHNKNISAGRVKLFDDVLIITGF